MTSTSRVSVLPSPAAGGPINDAAWDIEHVLEVGRAAHRVAVEAERALLHAAPRLTAALVHADPVTGEPDPHEALAHHAVA